MSPPTKLYADKVYRMDGYLHVMTQAPQLEYVAFAASVWKRPSELASWVCYTPIVTHTVFSVRVGARRWYGAAPLIGLNTDPCTMYVRWVRTIPALQAMLALGEWLNPKVVTKKSEYDRLYTCVPIV